MKHKLALFAISLILFASTAAVLKAQGLSCAGCGRAINTEYLEYQGLTYCSKACFQAALPKCSACGKTVGGGAKQGDFFKVSGRIFCSEKCFEASLPKCSACGKPARKQIRAEDDTINVFCSQDCYQTTIPKCEICNRPLTAWTQISRHYFCNDCAKLPRCLNCRLPGAETKLPDARHICKKCEPSAITSQDKAGDLFIKIRREMLDRLRLSTGHRITFRLVSAAELEKITGVQVFSEQGLYSHKWKTYLGKGTRVPDSDTFVIYILSHLSPAYFHSITAHELAHDIHDEMFPNAKGKETEEGFAEYISSLMNAYWGNDSLNNEKLENQEKIYSQAYAKFLRLAEKDGLTGVLAYMEAQNKAPVKGKSRKKSR